ncbi:MAG: 3-methylcrotonyl-CoA carboxylase, partial [Candidatus Eremiobacteraeota bacterium]|nr:3-methylcrotonyl-CoA carboxylase [Candidatus Eremiobacteraeota bacterium]
VVHLGERECSIQRRYQKIIEESPSPAMTPELRQKMGEAAVAAARAIGYTNAGTVEFILAEDGSFYFLEVNTRLQVEHPVTELVYAKDLVRLQLEVAQGKPLGFDQSDLSPRGWAIECRLYAEDPNNNFLPSIGTLGVFEPPQAAGIRLDSGVEQGSQVTVHFDPMLAKLVVWGETRAAALQKMLWALRHFVVLGVTTNLEFLAEVLAHPEFEAGNTHTHFLAEHQMPGPGPAPLLAAALAGLAQARPGKGPVAERAAGPWVEMGPWRHA